MTFIVLSSILFLLSVVIGFGYIKLQEKACLLNGAKRDIVRMGNYLLFLLLIIGQMYFLDQFLPRKSLRFFVFLPFIGGLGYLILRHRKLKELNKLENGKKGTKG
ncbi:MAG: hypothetical protein GY928_28270 [Colwellia sp.]|nr:hypothetical protein [Colwellia sp.]